MGRISIKENSGVNFTAPLDTIEDYARAIDHLEREMTALVKKRGRKKRTDEEFIRPIPRKYSAV